MKSTRAHLQFLTFVHYDHPYYSLSIHLVDAALHDMDMLGVGQFDQTIGNQILTCSVLRIFEIQN